MDKCSFIVLLKTIVLAQPKQIKTKKELKIIKNIQKKTPSSSSQSAGMHMATGWLLPGWLLAGCWLNLLLPAGWLEEEVPASQQPVSKASHQASHQPIGGEEGQCIFYIFYFVNWFWLLNHSQHLCCFKRILKKHRHNKGFHETHRTTQVLHSFQPECGRTFFYNSIEKTMAWLW
jgi:hypothetical protein